MDAPDCVPLLVDHVGPPQSSLAFGPCSKPIMYILKRKFRLKQVFGVAVVLGLVLCLFLFVSCNQRAGTLCPDLYSSRMPAALLPRPPSSLLTVSYDSMLQDNFNFNINATDVMVFLHIQKTGGTMFGKHLVQDIDLEAPCICHRNKKKKKKQPSSSLVAKKRGRFLRCQCFRPNAVGSNWLFSRYSMGWKCGLHADWTELNECVDEYLNAEEGFAHRRYFFITLLRDPVTRYLSEFRHVQRGATWKGSEHVCNRMALNLSQVAPCFDLSGNWANVSLHQFMSCPTNWAINRQTRMLADLRLVGCYNMSYMSAKQRDDTMLASAKVNLERMAFYGLTEQQQQAQFLFEEIFNLKFKVRFMQVVQNDTGSDEHGQLDASVLQRIADINRLDVELYSFAKKLMASRFHQAKANDPYYEEHFSGRHYPSPFSFSDISDDNDNNDEDDDVRVMSGNSGHH